MKPAYNRRTVKNERASVYLGSSIPRLRARFIERVKILAKTLFIAPLLENQRSVDSCKCKIVAHNILCIHLAAFTTNVVQIATFRVNVIQVQSWMEPAYNRRTVKNERASVYLGSSIPRLRARFIERVKILAKTLYSGSMLFKFNVRWTQPTIEEPLKGAVPKSNECSAHWAYRNDCYTKCGGFDKLNHRNANLLDSLFKAQKCLTWKSEKTGREFLKSSHNCELAQECKIKPLK